MSTTGPQLRLGDVPERLPDLMRLSEEKGWRTARTLVSTITGMPRVRRALDDLEIHHRHGRKRNPGSWPLAYLVFVVSGHVDIQAWWQQFDPTLWHLMGFGDWAPAYPTVYERFIELETRIDEFQAIADGLIGDARKRDSRVGRWLHLDATEAETHASPQHDCRPGDACRTHNPHGGIPRRLGRASTGDAARVRQAAAQAPAGTNPAGTTARGLTQLPIERRVHDTARGGVRFRSGGHYWFTRDPEAGLRAYSAGRRTLKAWFGYYNNKVIDHYTRAVIAVHVHPADTNEAALYPTMYEKARASIGADPQWVAGDRGIATKQIYEHNTRRGVATAAPYRRVNGSSPEYPPAGPSGPHGPMWDELGQPLCQHCGGATAHKGFSPGRGPGRLAYRCLLPQTTECRSTKKISCANNYLQLIPHPRTSDAHAAMMIGQKNLEGPHDDWRDRYRVGGKSLKERPKRIGIAWQQLRATAALVIEWTWVHIRMGWAGRPRVAGRARRHTPERLAKRHRAHTEWIERMKQAAQPSSGTPPA